MPYIKIETSKELSNEKKSQLCQQLVNAFKEVSSEAVAKNIQFVVEDNCWIQFRGEVIDSAHIQLSPGPLTPYADYPKLIEAFFPILTAELDTPANQIYMNIIEFDNWGFNNQMVIVEKHA